MKEILEKYSNKPNAKKILKEESQDGAGIDTSKIEDAARGLHGQIKKFVELAGSLQGNENFKQALAYLRGAYKKLPHFMALEMMGESVEVGAEDLTKMSDREEDKVADMAKGMKSNVKVVKEESAKDERYVAKASFYVYVGPDEKPDEKARELLNLIDKNHDGSNPQLLGDVEKASQRGIKYETVKSFSKKDFLNEIAVREKGYKYSGTLTKEAFLKKMQKDK